MEGKKMQIEEFIPTLTDMAPEFRLQAHRLIELKSQSHVKWPDAGRSAREGYSEAGDDTPEEKALYVGYDMLALLLATTPAQTSEDMVAQIEWLKEDLGDHIIGSVSEPSQSVFDVLIKSAHPLSPPTAHCAPRNRGGNRVRSIAPHPPPSSLLVVAPGP
jgi:hypothetical protein